MHSMAKILDGKAISASIKEGIRVRVQELEAIYGQRPALAVVIVGSDPASCSYVHSKVAAAEYLGIHNLQVELPETASEQEVLDAIRSLNENRNVDGILVQLPLPRGIDEEKVIEAVSYEKDVDGFHPMNVAHLWMGGKNMKPCTPKGIMRLLDESGIEISGRRAVVVGRSNIVGKPVAKLLLDRNATVTIAHSRSADLGAVTREADILVSAVGRPGMITADMIKPGAVVIDVGTTRGEDGKLHGDVDFEAAREVAGWITPVPGGVGPMTIAMLMENTLECFIERMTGEKAGIVK